MRATPSPTGRQALSAIPLARLAADARALESEAAALRAALAAPAPQPEAEAPSAPASGGLLRRFLTDPLKKVLDAMPADKPAEAPAPRPPVDRIGEHQRQLFEGAVAFAAGVLSYVSPRLLLVKIALETLGLPGRKRAWEEAEPEFSPAGEAAGVEPPLVPWIELLGELFYDDVDATRQGHIAIVRWTTAEEDHARALALQERLKAASKPSVLLANFDRRRYEASIFPISHLYLTFKDTELLKDLFPAPANAPDPKALSSGIRRKTV